MDWFTVDTAVRVAAPMALEMAAFRRYGAQYGGAATLQAQRLQAATLLLEQARRLRSLDQIASRQHLTSIAHVLREIIDATAAIPLFGDDRFTEAVLRAYDLTAGGRRLLPDAITVLNAAVGAATSSRRALRMPDRAALIVRFLDLDVHSIAELDTAMVAADYALERGGGHDERLQMDMLRKFRPVMLGIEKAEEMPHPQDSSGHPLSGVDSRFRRPIWAGLPGGEGAHPDWSTFMVWSHDDRREWLGTLLWIHGTDLEHYYYWVAASETDHTGVGDTDDVWAHSAQDVANRHAEYLATIPECEGQVIFVSPTDDSPATDYAEAVVRAD